MTPDLLLWDHDGVLVDTEARYFETTQLALANWGIQLSRERWLWGQAQGFLLEQFNFPSGSEPIDFKAIRRFRDQAYLDLLSREDVLIEGAEEVLTELGQRFRMGMVTNNKWEFLHQIHSRGSILDHFEHIVTAEDCDHHKPNPEPYLRALDLFGYPSQQALAIEDSERGLRAAVAAGIRCMIVKSPMMDGGDFELAEGVLDSLSQIPATLTVEGDS